MSANIAIWTDSSSENAADGSMKVSYIA